MKVEWVKMSSIRDNFLYFTLVLQTEKKIPPDRYKMSCLKKRFV